MKAKLKEGMQGFRTLLISYFCVFLFPCLLLIVFVQNSYIKQTDEYVIHVLEEKLNTVISELDTFFYDMESSTKSIFYDSDFRGRLAPNDINRIRSVQSKLNMLTLNHKYVEEIVVYQHGSDYLFSSASSYQKKLFCNIFRFEDMSQEEALAYFDNDSSGTVNAVKNREVYKIFRKSGKSYMYYTSIFFIVDMENLQKMMLEQLENGVGMLCIMDSEGNVFAWQSNDQEFDEEHYRSIIREARKSKADDEDRLGTIVYEGGINYVIAEAKSELNGYRFILVNSRDPLSQQMKTQRVLWKALIVLLFFSGATCVLCLSILTYRPIRMLKEKSECLQNQMNHYQQYLVTKLLRNELRKGEESKLICDILDFNPSETLIYVNLVKVNAACSEKEMMEHLLRGKIGCNHYVVKELERDKSFAVIWTVKKEEEQLLDIQLESVYDISGIDKIVCSERCSIVEQVPGAFLQVSTLDEMTKKQAGIFWFESGKERLLPVTECREIEEQINAGNWEAANACLEHLKELCGEKELYWNLYACMYLANVLSNVKSYLINSAEKVDVFMILKNFSKNFCSSYLQEISAFFAREAEKYAWLDKANTPVIEKMKLYLAERYNDPNFAFWEMAEEYSMSLPALSKYFNDKCEMTLNDYVTELKIQRAKYLLENTDISAAEIGREVGYYNAGSFSRRFRQITGQSPLEYRRSCGNSSE